jgi:hypothetical protein
VVTHSRLSRLRRLLVHPFQLVRGGQKLGALERGLQSECVSETRCSDLMCITHLVFAPSEELRQRAFLYTARTQVSERRGRNGEEERTDGYVDVCEGVQQREGAACVCDCGKAKVRGSQIRGGGETHSSA